MYTTLKEFETIPDGSVFRIVTTDFHYEGVKEPLTFVCKKGHGYNDWCIYHGLARWGVEEILSSGDKLMTESKIRSVFPCDDEVFSNYRY